MPHDGLGNGKVYSKRTCPFHKHEPAVKIFDDDIEKYLSDDPRASVLLEQKLNKLPLLPNASKHNKIKNKITSAKNEKIEMNAFSRKELEYYSDNVIDLTAREIIKVKSKTKENDALNKQRNLKSDVLIPNLKLSIGKRSIKEKNSLKIASFPKLYHSQNRIKIGSDKSIAKSLKSHKYTVDARTSEFLTYSQQYAYKALRHLTLDKSLNFKTKMWIETSDKSRASTDRSIVDTDDKSDVAESESPESGTRSPEFPFFLEVQKRLKETLDINVEKHKYKLLRSSSDKSSMIPAKSLAKSAFSTKFARYEIWESPSASILDAIPKVSCFRRKNCDRCLSCMHKSRRKMDEIKDISSRTTPLTKIEGKDDSESSSDELPEFSGELRKIYLRKKVKYREKIEDLSSKSMSDEQHRVEQEDTVISMKIDSDQSKGKTPKPTENLLSKDSKSLKAISSSISISSEKSKVSSSDAHTSDDETSSPLALDNDPSQYKNMAPCHLPTILLPSMEPLRALKYRKATTMEARIALMESVTSTKEKSDEEYYDDIKPATSKISKDKRKVAEKSEEIDDEKDMSLKSPRVLLKVKSEQQLISSIAEPTRKGELKRGYSYMGIKNLSKDSTRSTFETPRSEEEDGREKVIFLEKSPKFRDF
nr:PREDICTED: uncharacterized protein LOC105673961 [Linepithema humile]